MVHVCAWCERFLGFKEPVEARRVTHGICDPCFRRQTWSDAPVLVVSRDKQDMVPVLQNLLRGDPEIRIVVDRREAERRSPGEPVEPSYDRRRRVERRRSADLVVG